jgi:ElaB/YqjD/DUF883 family membrane-anchored ribosome-binding protein
MSAPNDPVQLQQDIDRVRGELADTVNALAAKADVKSRARDTVQQLKAQVSQKAGDVRDQALAKAPQLAGAVQQRAERAQRVVQDQTGVAVGAALAVFGLLVLRGRHRRKTRSR